MSPSAPSGPTSSAALRVVIVGGGLAGMAAAVALKSAGLEVTLLEASRRLGGASSFEDPKTGEELDNCQHVLLGCCTNLIDFYRRLGVDQLIRYERAIHFRDPAGRRHDLRGVRGWPAPLNLAPAMAAFGVLTVGERYAVARAMIAMLWMGHDGRAALADMPFGQWLDMHDQPPSLVEKFYDPVLISALNEQCRRAGASHAIHVFQDAMLANERGYVMGMPACPLAKLYEKLPCRDVRLGARVSDVSMSDGRVNGIELQSGEVMTADAYILATNYHAVQKWLPPQLTSHDARFAALDQFQSVPILGAHLWFDRPVLAESHAALISGPLQWLFRKDDEGRVLHGVISAARDWIDRPKEVCLKLFEAQIREVLPAARDAVLQRGAIVIEKRATFSPLPGIDNIRPRQSPPSGGISNLFLAGDYTQTGWPATMEGAVRSGYLAAEAIVNQSAQADRTPRRFIVDDLPIQWPARLMGLSKMQP